MIVSKNLVILRGCRRCGGDLYQDDGYSLRYGKTGLEYRCLQCGRPRSEHKAAAQIPQGPTLRWLR